MKTRYLALLLAPLFTTGAMAAGYTGPGAQPVTTVAAANDAADDTPVVLQGFVVKKLNNDDKYEFKDASGTITVEIDNEDLPARGISPSHSPAAPAACSGATPPAVRSPAGCR